jgi:hypothetical protein
MIGRSGTLEPYRLQHGPTGIRVDSKPGTRDYGSLLEELREKVKAARERGSPPTE